MSNKYEINNPGTLFHKALVTVTQINPSHMETGLIHMVCSIQDETGKTYIGRSKENNPYVLRFSLYGLDVKNAALEFCGIHFCGGDIIYFQDGSVWNRKTICSSN